MRINPIALVNPTPYLLIADDDGTNTTDPGQPNTVISNRVEFNNSLVGWYRFAGGPYFAGSINTVSSDTYSPKFVGSPLFMRLFNPYFGAGVTTKIYAALADWDKTTLTFNTQPNYLAWPLLYTLVPGVLPASFVIIPIPPTGVPQPIYGLVFTSDDGFGFQLYSAGAFSVLMTKQREIV